MVKKVYIIHGSAVVQSGLADILRKNPGCFVKSFYSVDHFQKAEEPLISPSLFVVEDDIKQSEGFKMLLNQYDNFRTLIITSAALKRGSSELSDSLFIYDQSDEISYRVSEAFEQMESSDEEAEGLSEREIDVLKLVALGYANKEIAEKLFISIHTVMSHRKNMTEKLGIKSISGLTVYAIINNYIDTTNLDLKDLI